MSECANLLTVVKGRLRVNNDIKKHAEWAISQRWRVDVDANGHARFYNPAGVYIADYPCTPSSRRRLVRLETDLKRAGLPWPPPSKKEKRSARRKGKQP